MTMMYLMLKNNLSGSGHTFAYFQDVGDQDLSQEAHENKASVLQCSSLVPTLLLPYIKDILKNIDLSKKYILMIQQYMVEPLNV